MIRRFVFAALSLVLLSLSGCATTAGRTLIGQVRPARSPHSVRVYEQAPKHFEQIALIEGQTVFDLRLEAGKVGANGVLIGGVFERPTATIGIGLGSTTVDYERRHAFAYGTNVSYEAPLGSNRILRGTAIYVP